MKMLLFRSIFAVAIAAVAASATLPARASTFSVGGSGNTFIITRSGEGTNAAETVRFRTVGLSAYAGQNFNARSGTLTFAPGETAITNTVPEGNPANTPYWFQNSGTTRSYKLEVTDPGGFFLAGRTRNISTGAGTQLSTTYLNNDITSLAYFYDGEGSICSGYAGSNSHNSIRYLDVAHAGSAGTWTKVTDSGYKQAVHTMSTDALYDNSVQRSFLNGQGTKMYATVYFTQKEEQDGYQYIQIHTGSTYDGNDPNGDVDDPVASLYKACFILSYDPSGSVETTPHTQFFPHRWDFADNDAQYRANGWRYQEFDYTNAHLYAQKFLMPDLRAEKSGSLVLPPTISSINVRFDAAGSGGDTWYFKDLKVRLALVDTNAPTVVASSVAPGRHAKGNTLYLSVAFSEPVTISGDIRKLATSWGNLAYLSGSGGNVLTFSGIIAGDASQSLNVTGLTGSIADLAGNNLPGSSVNADGLCTLDANDLSLLDRDDSGRYLIASFGDLHILSAYVSAGNTCSGLTFLQTADITFPHTTSWDDASSTENNFSAIGNMLASFEGIYDGGGHTVSGLRIYKGGDSDSHKFQGLFGYVNWTGTARNVHLADTRITGYVGAGGIAGYSSGYLEDCTVSTNVCIHAVHPDAYRHGGIVGENTAGSVSRCISRARLTVKSDINPMSYGGIVGYFYGGTISDCIAVGVTVPNVKARGAIAGRKESSATLTRNFYRACTVAGRANAVRAGVGTINSTSVSDTDGAQHIYAITLSNGAALVRTPSATLLGTGNATYDTGADIDGAPYAYAGATVTLAYAGSLPTGHTFTYGASAGTLDGDRLTMPAADVTVTAILIPPPSVPFIDWNGDTLYCTAYTVLTNAAGNVTYGSGWYVVTNDVTISGKLFFVGSSNSHLILCDGATLTVTNRNGAAIETQGNLTIFGQTNGTGTIVATGSIYGISAGGNVAINGGTVTAEGNTGISAHGADSIVTINGGIVTAIGRSKGIKGGGRITLGWMNPTDSIYASSYNLTVNVNRYLTDGIGGIYHLYTAPSDLAGKTLRPFVTTPTYPAYLAEADNNVTNNYDAWAARYGYDALGVNETAFLLDVAPGAVTNGVTPLKVVELGSTNVFVAGSVYEMLLQEYRIDYDEDYLPCRRIVLESGAGALKPGPWREYSGTPSSFDICNGYVVLRFTHDLSLPKSEWWAISWFVDFEGDRAVVLVPTMFKEHIRMVIEQQLNRPVGGLFLSVGIEPYTVIDPDTILTFFPMTPVVE